MKIYTRRSRSIRHLILALVWFSLVVYQLFLGEPLGIRELLFVMAGGLFGYLFYSEWTHPYVVLKYDKFICGLWHKQSIDCDDIKSFEAKAGVLKVSSDKKTISVNMMRLSQKDREAIYERLMERMPEEEKNFREQNDL